jgi:hypothetical protein
VNDFGLAASGRAFQLLVTRSTRRGTRLSRPIRSGDPMRAATGRLLEGTIEGMPVSYTNKSL